jgi:hypothetical protein
MGPLTVITGIVLGTCLSIAVSLAAVMLMVLLIGDENPRLGHEFPALLGSLLVFSTLTVISATSFYSLLKQHAVRWVAHGALWAAIAGTGFYYWP